MRRKAARLLRALANRIDGTRPSTHVVHLNTTDTAAAIIAAIGREQRRRGRPGTV